MMTSTVSIVKYERPGDSVREAISLAGGLDGLEPGMKVFIKPNIVYWTKQPEVTIPKWGVITTTRVVEDVVLLLKERGIEDITIGEGTVTEDPKDTETMEDAWVRLGYNLLAERHGVKLLNVFQRPFEKIDLGLDFPVNFNADALAADFLVNLPVLKTHAQAVVSLGIKNLKGLIDIPSRKKFHAEGIEHDLDYNIAHLADKVPPGLTLLDGIYTIERGPGFDGRARRSNILAASTDMFAADMVGAALLGKDPRDVPHLVHVAKNWGKPVDMSWLDVVGENLEGVSSYHEHDYVYVNDDTLPLPYQKAGITGVSYRKYDRSMCTYCSAMNGILLTAIKMAWDGKPFGDVEILTGKHMVPTPGKAKTILVGQCQYAKNKEHPEIKELIPIKGCPPSMDQMKLALETAGIDVPKFLYDNLDKGPMLFYRKYRDRPEFSEDFYQVA